MSGIADAVAVEKYPDYTKEPCALLLQTNRSGVPIHVVWKTAEGHDRPVALVTAYRPYPGRGVNLSRGSRNDETAEETETFGGYRSRNRFVGAWVRPSRLRNDGEIGRYNSDEVAMTLQRGGGGERS